MAFSIARKDCPETKQYFLSFNGTFKPLKRHLYTFKWQLQPKNRQTLASSENNEVANQFKFVRKYILSFPISETIMAHAGEFAVKIWLWSFFNPRNILRLRLQCWCLGIDRIRPVLKFFSLQHERLHLNPNWLKDGKIWLEHQERHQQRSWRRGTTATKSFILMTLRDDIPNFLFIYTV